ncbi:MAG: hypothetical protein AAF645_05755 [Myxococcota bacterium]
MKREPNPILIKELRATFRTPLFVRFLYLATGVVGILVLMVGAIAASEGTPPAQVGQTVFLMFFGLAVAVVSLVVPAASSTTITAEVEGSTFESLLLTGMDPARIVVGKFLANFATFGLVVVAMSPVVAIAFLFGGVSPLRIFWAFFGLFVLLAIAVAWGVSVSARVRTTRTAIIVSTLLFQPVVLYGTVFVGVAGFAMSGVFSSAENLGPFWFADTLALHFFRLDAFVLVFLLPIYAAGLTIWFLLASAIASVRPAAEDRSTPFKVWALAALFGQVLVLFAAFEVVAGGRGGLSFDPRDWDDLALGLQFASAALAFFFAALFANEPPLPPRLWQLRSRRSHSWLGPGAAGTTQAGMLLIGASVGLATGVAFLYGNSSWRYVTAFALTGATTFVVASFYLYLGAWLRVTLRSGAAARVLAFLVLLVTLIFALLGRLIVPELKSAFDCFSPVQGYVAAVEQLSRHRALDTTGPISVGLYALLTLTLYLLLRARVRRAQVRLDERRAHTESLAAAREAAQAGAPQ